MMDVREFNVSGLHRFSEHISLLRQNQVDELTRSDLEEDKYTSIYKMPLQIDPAFRFDNLFELGSYLLSIFPSWTWEEVMETEKDGLWAWLTAVFFSQLHKATKKSLCNGKQYYFIPSQAYDTYYRHKLRLAFALISEKSIEPSFAEWLLKNQDAKEFGATLEDTVAYKQNLKSQSLQRFILAHYRTEDGGIRKNTSSKWKGTKTPEKFKGNLRRFNLTMKRISTVADVEEMDNSQIGAFWGPEYQNTAFKIASNS